MPRKKAHPLRSSAIAFAFFIALLVLAFFLYTYTQFGQHIDQTRSFIASTGPWAPAVFIASFVIATILAVPLWVFTLISALLFGVWWGTLWAVIGALLGACAAFWIARTFGHRFVQRLLERRMREARDAIKHNAMWGIFSLRVILPVPYNLLNYVAGLTRMSFRDFFWGSLLGFIPSIFVYVYLFGSVQIANTAGLPLLFNARTLMALFLLALLSLMPWLHRACTRLKYSHGSF